MIAHVAAEIASRAPGFNVEVINTFATSNGNTFIQLEGFPRDIAAMRVMVDSVRYHIDRTVEFSFSGDFIVLHY